MNLPITQSESWQSLQNQLGATSFYKKGKGYTYLALLNSTPVGNYFYVPYGPVYKDKDSFERAVQSLTDLAKDYHAIFIRIEPQDPDFPSYAPENAQKTTDLNPKETWLLDLTGNEDDLKAKLPSRLLRYYRTAPKKGLKLEKSHNSDDIRYLVDLQTALASQKHINTFSEEYLKAELSQPFATLYLLKQYDLDGSSPKSNPENDPNNSENSNNPENDPNGSAPDNPAPEVLAAGLVFDYDSVRYNLQGAQTEQGRKLHATGILTIGLILDAKEKGLKAFDFWGIAPENAPADHPWAGFTAFKKTFTGFERRYAGTYDLVQDPSRYHLYCFFRRLNRLRRKI